VQLCCTQLAQATHVQIVRCMEHVMQLGHAER
jgi:hypothetical protein